MIPARLSRRRLGQLLGSLAFPLALLGPAVAADPTEFSEAEKLVFVEHQLANIKAPTTLRYTFVKSGSLEPGFEDEVSLDVSRVGPAGSSVKGRFLSGARTVRLPDVDGAQANPVILYFLEHDIRDMERLTKGKSAYFRKRIRMTMAEAAAVRDTRIAYNGSQVEAKEVSLSPYVNDPNRPRFEKYAQKRYVFLLSEAVPGGVYQVRTTMPGAQPGDAPILEEVLTLAGPAARSPSAAPTAANPSPATTTR